MALGGVLRAALRAGDWARAAAQSRRQARALRGFSPEFGERGSRMQPGEWLRSRGVDSPDDVYRFSELPDEFGGGFGAQSVTPDGRTLFRSMEGPEQRITYNPDMLRPGYSPIVAPYEGVRSWGGYRLPFDERVEVGAMPSGFGTARAGTPFSMNVPEWMGRGAGPAPSVGRFAPRDMSYGGGRLYDDVLGERQGLPFYAPNVPVPLRDSFYGYY